MGPSIWRGFWTIRWPDNIDLLCVWGLRDSILDIPEYSLYDIVSFISKLKRADEELMEKGN